MNWEPLNLRELGERPSVTPSIGNLVYPGRRHVFSGPPESLKTFAAFFLAIDVIRASGVVLHVDFEMFAYETRDRLRSMGVTDEELDRFLHIEPEVMGSPEVVGDLVERWKPTLCIIDAAAGAYALQGLDDNQRKDAETFAQALIEPFRAREVATILIDHVAKKAEGRGAFAIGSERKIGGADVHLGFEPVTPLARGGTGLVRINVHKDRFGYLPRPHAADLEVRSDHETHAVTWAFVPVAEAAAAVWEPTVLMERVSLFLEGMSEPVSRSMIEKNVHGKDKWRRQAINALVAGGYAEQTGGTKPGTAKLVVSLKPYRDGDVPPTSAQHDDVDLRPSSAPGEPPADAKSGTFAHSRPTSTHVAPDHLRPSGLSPSGEGRGQGGGRRRLHTGYRPDEMDADHVTAWSKGGNTDLENCQMLCVTHNLAKGNK